MPLGHAGKEAFMTAGTQGAIDDAINYMAQSQGVLKEDLLLDTGDGWQCASAIEKGLQFIKYTRHNDTRLNTFEEQAGKTLIAPNSTRWNSWFNALKRLYSLQDQVDYFIRLWAPDTTKYILTDEDWEPIKATITFLQPFHEATLKTQGDQATLEQMQVTMDFLNKHLHTSRQRHIKNQALTTAILNSHYVFDKYYKIIDNTPVYTAAVLLHPSKRLNYLNKVWNKKWIKPGVDRVRHLFESQYKDKYLPPSKEQEPTIIEEPSELEKWQRDLAIDTTTNELKSFIESTPITTNNPLTWWLDPINQEQFPCLSKMAIDVLSIHIMSADSERVFSGSRRMVTWERARLGVQSVERNECLKSWNISGLVDRTLSVAMDTTTSGEDTLPQFLEVM
ncbi:hypothetical protein D6C78_09762 [Aureobasidium pullulans]|uniref:HAT C-terminal dimerisation domain-containing protein n=1 Tax=Aureobasidium pullulans TaxID=5580 RepID=A0A4T0B7R2_AURPU|nr:hypothetical protein D6C78_09762 [Aureobasidium pullulans]